MSKVTIKFWDKEKKIYDETKNYVVNEAGSPWHVYGGMDAQLDEVDDFIEPHFYKDGERIA